MLSFFASYKQTAHFSAPRREGSKTTRYVRSLLFIRQRGCICRAEVGLFFSTSTGHTEDVAGLIKQELGESASDPQEIADAELSSLTKYDGLIVGAPTWNTGADTERSGTNWDNILDDLRGQKVQDSLSAGLDLKGKPIAVFGLGDSVSYGDNFADAMEEIHDVFKEAGGDMVGYWPTKGYQHSESKAQIDDETFCGLPLDEDNEDDLTLDRIKAWVQQLKKEMKL